MNNKIKILKEDLFKSKREISIERAKLYTESFKETDNEPIIIRRAKALKHILENVNISIRTNEILAGNRTIKPRSGIISPEMDPYWIMSEIDTIDKRLQDKFIFNENDKKFFKTTLYSYWKNNSLKDLITSEIDENVKEAINLKIVKLNQTDKGQGHIIPNFEEILNQGLKEVLNNVENHLIKFPDNLFYKASKISLLATQKHILKYRNLALDLANKEYNSERKIELLNMAKCSKNISEKKPKSFYEACQLLWYMSLTFQYESNASSISLGRFDQYMYPFYKKDIEKGVAKEKLKEILEAFYIKTNDVVLVRSEKSAEFFAGFPTGYTMILGGMNSKGFSSVNELSSLCLEAYRDIQLPQPNIGVRLNDSVDREFLLDIVKTIKLGTGIPQIFNDEIVIPSFLNRGVKLEDARNYAVVGCVELSIPGKMYGLHDIAMFNMLKIMEITFKENKDYKDISYEFITEKMKENMDKYIEIMAYGSNIVDNGHKKYAPVPLLSTFIKGCLDTGKELTEGGAIYNFSGVQGIGTANLSDSLYVLKKLLENNEIDFPCLIEILNENYKDNNYFRLKFINKFSKFGNDVDEVDFIGSDLLRHYCKKVEKCRNPRGGIFIPGSYTVSAHVPLGKVVGATPDGRKSGEQLADGGLSPMVGKDKLGPTAVLKSVSKLDNILLTNGSLLNVKFGPNTLKDDTGLNKLADFLVSFMDLKIQHIQFNIIDTDTLKEAQSHPEKYSSLIVRVAGYSAFFNELSHEIQNDIINRTQHSL